MAESTTEFLSVVIPAYNEAAAIASVVNEIKTALRAVPCPTEIVVVDDASRDATAAIVDGIPDVRLVRNPLNLGYGHSLLRGIAAARGNLIAICDADGSYDPSKIPELYGRVQAGVDHAIGRRTGRTIQRPLLLRSIYRWLCSYVVGVRVPDANSGLRIFRREVAEVLRRDLCLGFSFTTSLTLASYMSGFVVGFTDIEYRRRVGRSHVRFRDTLRTAQYLFQLIAAYNPVKLFLPLVAGSTFLAALGALVAMLGGPSWASFAAVTMTATTLILVALAAHAHIVSRSGLAMARRWSSQPDPNRSGGTRTP